MEDRRLADFLRRAARSAELPTAGGADALRTLTLLLVGLSRDDRRLSEILDDSRPGG